MLNSCCRFLQDRVEGSSTLVEAFAGGVDRGFRSRYLDEADAMHVIERIDPQSLNRRMLTTGVPTLPSAAGAAPCRTSRRPRKTRARVVEGSEHLLVL